MNIVFRTEDGLQDAADCLFPALRGEGLSRDVVIADTDIRDWRACLDGLQRAGFGVTLSRPFHVSPPWRLNDLFAHVKETGPVQGQFALGNGITARCDFRAADEIAIKIELCAPPDLSSVQRILALMTTMGRCVGKEVCLCNCSGCSSADVIASCDWKAERLTVRRGNK